MRVNPATGAAVIGAAAFLGSGLYALAAGVPLPRVHDEFAYLLAGETFASGRVTNPTPPYWEHFETFHVIVQPTYASKYPPAQGIILAIGEAVGGHPIIGVWLSVGLMCAAITWMLYAWLPPRWALLGGAFALVQFGVSSYWAQSYWGGAVAAAGGALVFGSSRRLVTEPRLRYGLLLGAGLWILAASRPFEGLLTAMLVVPFFLYEVLRRGLLSRRVLVAVVGALLVSGAGLAWLGYVNWRTTGSAARMAYQEHEAQYAAAPSFLWQEAIAPDTAYRHAEIQRYWVEWGVQRHQALQRPDTFVVASFKKLAGLLLFYLGPGVLALALLSGVFKDSWTKLALASCVAIMGFTLLTKGTYPHYVAPVAGPLLLLMFLTLHDLARRRRVWRYPGKILSIVILVSVVIVKAVMTLSTWGEREGNAFAAARHQLQVELEQRNRKHVVVVRYGPEHNYHEEWVYNSADLESSAVVWARDLGSERNQALLEHFYDREHWLLELNGTHKLSRYYDRVVDAANQ